MKKLNVEDSLNILDAVYKNVVQGVPKVSKPVEVLALDYVQKYKKSSGNHLKRRV